MPIPRWARSGPLRQFDSRSVLDIAVAALMALMALERFLPASEGVVYHLVAGAVIWLMATGIYHAGRNIKEEI